MQGTRRDFLAGAAAAGAMLGAPIRPANAAPTFFKLYMMIPNNQPARMAWGTLCARQIAELGVEVIPNYVPFAAILPRRNKGDGKTYVDGGWDAYFERYYYSSVVPLPEQLFSPAAMPPNGPNFYYLDDPVLNAAMATYSATPDEATRVKAITDFEKRWYDTEPLTILFYPQDAIAVNPKLSGFRRHHVQPGLLSAAGELDDRRRDRQRHLRLRLLARAVGHPADVS